MNLTDIGGHWAEPAIVRMLQRGVVSGYEDQTFRPEAHAIPSWPQGQVAALVKAGIIHGRADGSFDPEAGVTCRAGGHDRRQPPPPRPYRHAGHGNVHGCGTAPAVGHGRHPDGDTLRLMVGDETGAFGPANPKTRAEVAALLDRMWALP